MNGRSSPTPAGELLDFAQVAAQVIQASSDGIAAFDREFRLTLWNETMEQISGVPAREALGRYAFEVLPFLRQKGEEERLRRVLAGMSVPGEGRTFSVPPTGRPGIYEATYVPLLAEGSAVAGGCVIVRDITASRGAQEQLRESEARFRTLADSAPVLLWMAGTDGLCSFFNQGWLDFTGRPIEMEMGSGWADGVHPEDFQHCMHTYLSAFVARRSFRMEYRLRRADGQYRWILDQGMPRYAPGGGFAGYIGSCIDISDFKEAHEALGQLKDELETRVEARTIELKRSNAELEEFAYVVSHDLQEPLRMISSYVQLLEQRYRDRLGPEADKFIHYVVDGARRMKTLISDLLTYSRVSRTETTPKAVDCGDALDLALENLGQVVEETGVKIVREPLPTVLADPTQLSQLFQNLVGNAIKFHSDAPPEVRIGSERRGREWVFTVKDNGIGIEPEHSERIFRVFQRLHVRDAYPGNGIGLAICKRIVERHGGAIWVESKPGAGAAFHFSLPAAEALAASEHAAESEHAEAA